MRFARWRCCPRPDRLKQLVAEPQCGQVQDDFLTQVMVDAVLAGLIAIDDDVP